MDWKGEKNGKREKSVEDEMETAYFVNSPVSWHGSPESACFCVCPKCIRDEPGDTDRGKFDGETIRRSGWGGRYQKRNS